MFNSNFYIPILKWKGAEKGALEVLTKKHRRRISPVIELVMPKPKSLYKDEKKKIKKSSDEILQELIEVFKTERIPEIPNEIINAWGTTHAFIDFSLLYTVELKVESIKEILKNSSKLGAKLIPIVNLSDSKEVKKEFQRAFKKYNNGVCLRVVSSDLDNIDKLNHTLDIAVKYFDTRHSNIDLLIDLKENGADYGRYFELSQKIKDLPSWRNLILACGTFPENLSECSIDEPTLIARNEWVNWLKIKGKPAKRIPTFSDYTVRNPIYDESLQFYHPTTSIKYTLEKEWLILKGRKKRFDIYLANASLLVGTDYFYGKDFSDGDNYIAEKAEHFKEYSKNPKIKGTGNTVMWLKSFINHHLTLTAHQIANLP